ncbi:MAG: GIY-YIG nuclease family protein, partial [Paludibacteraceae bacterium]
GSSPTRGTKEGSACVLLFLGMYYVYAISSLCRRYIYVGLTDNVARRLEEHNRGYNRSTKPYAPYELLFTQVCADRKEARRVEKYYKSGCGKEFLYRLRASQMSDKTGLKSVGQ